MNKFSGFGVCFCCNAYKNHDKASIRFLSRKNEEKKNPKLVRELAKLSHTHRVIPTPLGVKFNLPRVNGMQWSVTRGKRRGIVSTLACVFVLKVRKL